MSDIIIFSLISLLFGVIAGLILGFLFFHGKNNSELNFLLKNFQNSIDEFKNQNIINTREIKFALEDSSKLAKILTTNQNLKGEYAEDSLEVILESVFTQKNVNYIKQYVTKNENEKDIRPDYLINLPEGRSVVIDCKLNLEKFIRYEQEKNSELKRTFKTDFIKDINSTINNLSNKKYETAKNLTQPDFILMYIPLEPVLSLVYTDRDFLSVVKNANEKNIIIVGNSGILTTLRLIKLLWVNNTKTENTDKILNLAQNIYDLIAAHSHALCAIKNSLANTVENFDREYKNMLNSSKLFCAAEELKNLGIEPREKKTGKKLTRIEIESEFLK